MPDLEQRIKEDLDRLAERPDPSRILDRVGRRKRHLRVMHRVQTVALIVAVLAGVAGVPSRSTIAVSKAAVIALTRTLGAEWASAGVRGWPLTDTPSSDCRSNRPGPRDPAAIGLAFLGFFVTFAAPASIHSSVVEQLPPEIRDRIVEHVKSDLVKIEPAKLPSHFRSLQPL